MYLTSDVHMSKIRTMIRYQSPRRILILLFIMTIFSTILFQFSVIKSSDRQENSDSKLKFLLTNETMILNISNHSTSVYIDIGCFDGETVEHFIHFTSNSKLYDIITFEPDPANYKLCRERLKQDKYRNYSIIIIRKAVWIRNEKVSFTVNQGNRGRIEQYNVSKYLSIREDR